MEKISLYIPCYNAENTIRECLDSIINQSYEIDEILVIDDCSTDKSIDIIKDYPVRIIRHKENRGLAACRNTAFREARNEFVASLDSDCMAGRQWLAQLMRCFTGEDIAGVGGILIERNFLNLADKWRCVHMAQQWGEELLDDPPFLYGNNTVFRRSLVEKAGFFNEQYRTNYEDVDLSLRIYNRGLSLIYNPKAHVEHMKKDTINSVLYTYRNWFYYSCLNLKHTNQTFSRIAMNLGIIVEYPEIAEAFAREDLRAKNYELLPLDFMLVFYCMWLDLRQLAKILFLHKK